MIQNAEPRTQNEACDLQDLEQVWMQLALRAAADAHGVNAARDVSHPTHDSSITVATIHA